MQHFLKDLMIMLSGMAFHAGDTHHAPSEGAARFVMPHLLIAALCFRHSRTLLSSTPKIAAALRFPFSSAHRITSRLNFAVYDSLFNFWRTSSITPVHDKFE
jgi:hypothetical protein